MPESVISSQTSYPESPDTSIKAYDAAMGNNRPNAISRWWNSFIGKNPTYNQWRTEQRDQYNAQLQAYNSYITSLVGQRAQAEEAGYNPAWLGSDPGGGASPLDYQNAQDPADSVPGDIINGVNTFMSLASGGLNLQAKALQNDILRNEVGKSASDAIIAGARAKYAGRYYGFQASRLGYLSDFARFINEGEINSRFQFTDSDESELLFGSGELTNQYSVGKSTRKGFQYNKQYNELELRKAQKQWTKFKSQVASWDVSERKYYVDNIQPKLKELYEGKISVTEAQAELIRAQKENVGNAAANRTANTVTRAVLGALSLIAKFIPGGQFIPFDALEEWIDGDTGEVRGSKHTVHN